MVPAAMGRVGDPHLRVRTGRTIWGFGNMVSAMVLALVMTTPDVGAGRTPPRRGTHASAVGGGAKAPSKRKPAPHPHCEGETPDGKVASADKPTWGAFCRIIYS